MAQVNNKVVSIEAGLLWSAACAAYRKNNKYIKKDSEVINKEDPSLSVLSNATIVQEYLAFPESITDEDKENGKKCRSYFQAYTLRVLKNQPLSDFDTRLLNASNKDHLSSNLDIAVIISAPATWVRGQQKADVANRLAFSRGGLIGSKGEEISRNVEVLKSVWSKQYNCFFITAITDEDEPIFFARKVTLDLGSKHSIKGKVKQHREDRTQLTRVKIVTENLTVNT
jgi:hypothetical protein